ncbi:MAG: PEP-CTERM sorting domain-containing protein [Planctomycetota bacterium]
MRNLLAIALLSLGLATSAQGAVIATLQEGENDSVYFSLDVTNPDGFDYSGFNATHLDYIFFDNVGDYVDGLALGNNNNPTIFQPASHGLVGSSADGYTVGIQAIALDNDDQNPNDADDFVIRFIGQTSGLTNGTTQLNFVEMVDYVPVLIRGLSFSVLKTGSFSSTDAQAQALGGFQLEVVAVPEPGSAGLMALGVMSAGMFSRRRKARTN